MGCGSSSESSAATSRLIDKAVGKKKKSQKDVKKLLLLGAGGSGKSTFFKQLTFIHGSGFTERDRGDYRMQVHFQVLQSMKKLLDKASECVEVSPHKWASKLTVSASLDESVDFMNALPKSAVLTEEIAKHVSALWMDDAIQSTWTLRNELRCNCPDSSEHFFDNVHIVANAHYLPDEMDIFLVRSRSIGIKDISIKITDESSGASSQLRIFDVGGQRSERKKWYHFFNNVTAVLFVASLSSFNEVIVEDEKTNRMHEALHLFHQLTAVPYFESTPFILFLNKCDLFEEKLTRVALSVCFEDYTLPNEFDTATNFISEQFRIRDSRKLEQGLYIHLTTAIDTDNVFRLFQSVNYIVINANMIKFGVI